MAQSVKPGRRYHSSRISPKDSGRVPHSVAIVILALLLAAEVTRLTIASRLSDSNPELAGRLAPQSPATLAARAMVGVGYAAARGTAPSAKTFDHLRALAAIAPLRPEPMLVEAALAEKAGQFHRAEVLLIEARRRDPRSTAARYLLADVWLRQGKVTGALGEMAAVARLLPGAEAYIVPALVQFSSFPGAQQKLLFMVNDNPALKLPLLEGLAKDPANAELVLSLAGKDVRSTDPHAMQWKVQLLNGLIEKGEYGGAYAIWQKFAGIPAGKSPLLFNSDFSKPGPPPPFNWTFNSGAAGVAEPEDGHLRVVYYGRDNANLASQTLLLSPGEYRFRAATSGSVARGALKWRLTCVPEHKEILQTEVGSLSPVTFRISADCRAQMLSLNGISQDMPRDSDVQIGPILIERTGA